jgi:hypothetical protein
MATEATMFDGDEDDDGNGSNWDGNDGDEDDNDVCEGNRVEDDY